MGRVDATCVAPPSVSAAATASEAGTPAGTTTFAWYDAVRMLPRTAVPSTAPTSYAVSEIADEVGAVLGTAVLGSILTASYHANVVVPAGVPAADSVAAAETLGGATQVASTLPAGQAQALLDSAHAAFGSGVGTTSLIGVVLMLVAAGVALVTLRDAKS